MLLAVAFLSFIPTHPARHNFRQNHYASTNRLSDYILSLQGTASGLLFSGNEISFSVEPSASRVCHFLSPIK